MRVMLMLVLCGACMGVAFAGEKSALTATSAQPVWPVLIRNDQGPVTKVEIAGGDGSETLRRMEFSLAGTEDVREIERWELFATGDKQEFSASQKVGMGRVEGTRVAFEVNAKLRPGVNVFWLSCRLRGDADLAHHVAGVCTAVETMGGVLTPKDLTPGVRHRIGVAVRRGGEDGVHTYRIPALATTKTGALVTAYDMRRAKGRDLQEDIDIGMSRSVDGGRTWEPLRVIMDMGEYGGLPQNQNGCSDPGLIVDRETGEMFCFAVWMNGKPGKHQWTKDGSEPGYEIGKSAQMLMVRSKDDGKTWTKPENLTRMLKKEAWWLFAPSPQQGIQLEDGTLVMPAQGRDEEGKPFSTLMFSRDHGAHWTAGTPAYSGGSECQLVQLQDGSLMLNMRNDHDHFRGVAVTRDLGTTWSFHATHRKGLIEPRCNGSLMGLDILREGKSVPVLLFANPHTQTVRTHQTIQVSFDEGLTWPARFHLLLDEGRGAGYPSLTRVDGGHVGIVYEGSQAHLVFEKIALAELLQGR